MLITEQYKEQNARLHQSGVYGRRGGRHCDDVISLCKIFNARTILDYGCGKGNFKELIDKRNEDFLVINYDPCIPEFSKQPENADIVLCADVLEHIEPECLDDVLRHISSLKNKLVYFVIATKPDYTKTLPDGSNPHKIIEKLNWWYDTLGGYFNDTIIVKQTDRDITILAQ